jgi:hypothetical protein
MRLHVNRSRAATQGSTDTIAGRVSAARARVVIRPELGEDVIVRAVDGFFHARVHVSVGDNRFEVTAEKVGYATPDPVTVAITRRRRKPKPEPVATAPPKPNCDPNYAGACVPVASDVDCAGGSGNGPAYVQGPVRVVGTDVYDLDRDGDGIGCNT